MATSEDYNHIHPGHEKSYGHLHSKGGDHHLTSSPGRDEQAGRHGHDGKEM